MLDTAAGQVMLYSAGPVSGTLPPVLLVHSINAAGSVAEMAPLYTYFQKSRPVYALDLPGFGLSERSDRVYSPRLMTDAVLAALTEIQGRHAGAAVDVVALSLSGEYVVRAQREAPQKVRRIALVSPTGLNGKPRRYGQPGSTLGMPWLYRLLANPRWSDALFRGLTRPGVVRYFLKRSFGTSLISEPLWRYAVLTTQQPGAKFAPLYFLSAHLFSKDINHLYEAVDCPVWVSMATRGDFTNYTGRSTVEHKANWQFHAIEGGALPYFEDLNSFVSRLDPFLA
jgi:pimeloyl-ACP methyl ester carboxylesterase